MKGTWIRRAAGSSIAIFVHGLFSDGESCWRHPNGTYWPRLLADEPTLESLSVYVFTYKTGVSSGTYRLGDVVDALKEQLRLDEVMAFRQLIFIAYSMGGIVVRKFILDRLPELMERDSRIGVFLVASPSVGARYADLLESIARALHQTQIDVLRFSQENSWLLDLDKEFHNLKEDRRLQITGKELLEDRFIFARRFFRRQVVEPFSGARYFGDPLKVPDSDHFSICKPDSAGAFQHRTLVRFITDTALKAGSPSPIRAELAEQSASDEVAAGGNRAVLTAKAAISGLEEIARRKSSIIYRCMYGENPAILKKTDRAVCNIDALRILVEAREGIKTDRYGLTTEIALPLRVWEEGSNVVELQPFAEGVTLASMVHRSLPYRLRGRLLGEIFDSLLTVLQKFHALGVLHRDVNPSNILISAQGNGLHLTLIDCTSAWPTNVIPQVRIGNRAFTPPEQMEGYACEQSDWYSLAATCFFVANGEAPVLAQQESLLAGLRNTGILNEMEFEGSSRADDYRLLASLLEARPENRPQEYFMLKPKTDTTVLPDSYKALQSVMDLGSYGNIFIPGTQSHGQNWESVPVSKLHESIDRARAHLQIDGAQMQAYLTAQLRAKARTDLNVNE